MATFRKVLKPLTFSNKLTIPAGEILATPVEGIHFDDDIYENATEFDGFRFSKLREKNGENAKYYSVNTSPDFLVFGHGEHAW